MASSKGRTVLMSAMTVLVAACGLLGLDSNRLEIYSSR